MSVAKKSKKTPDRQVKRGDLAAYQEEVRGNLSVLHENQKLLGEDNDRLRRLVFTAFYMIMAKHGITFEQVQARVERLLELEEEDEATAIEKFLDEVPPPTPKLDPEGRIFGGV